LEMPPRRRLSAGMLNGVGGDRLAEIPGEEPLLWPHAPPIVAQRVEQFRREHDIAVLVAFALGHPDHHPLVVERAGLQAKGFGDAQTGGVAGLQDRLVFDVFDAAEEMENLRSIYPDLLRLMRLNSHLINADGYLISWRGLLGSFETGIGGCALLP
jgi:hypothetical protein